MLALQNNPYSLKYVKDQTTELCLLALSTVEVINRDIIESIKFWQVDMEEIIKKYPVVLIRYYGNDFGLLERVNAMEIISNYPDEPFLNITCKEFIKKHENRLKLLGRIK